MIADNQHFETLISTFSSLKERLPEGTFLKIDNDCQRYFFTFLITQNDITVRRRISVSRVDLENHIHVTMEDALQEPFCVMKVQEFRTQLDDRLTWEFRLRNMCDFILTPVDPKKVVPAEMVLKADEISRQWLASSATKVVPYLSSDEWGDEWRFKIVSANYPDIIYCQYLDPKTADGPMYSAIMRAFQDGVCQGRVEGATQAAERIAMKAFQSAFNGSGLAQHEIPSNVRDFMRHGFLNKSSK